MSTDNTSKIFSNLFYTINYAEIFPFLFTKTAHLCFSEVRHTQVPDGDPPAIHTGVVLGSLDKGAVLVQDMDLQVPLDREGNCDNLRWAASCSPVGGNLEVAPGPGSWEQWDRCCCTEGAAQNSWLAQEFT